VTLNRTALYDRHIAWGAKMVPFAGYDMPVQYGLGVLKEHLHTRASAGLFDVGHMGQAIIRGNSWEDVASRFEKLVPVNVLGLADGRQRYGLFTNEAGGILDDLMFARLGDDLFVVVNAACKEADFARLEAAYGDKLEVLDRSLLALQGPKAAEVLATLNPAVPDMRFMDVAEIELAGASCIVSRSGYTGEDGYEISVPHGAVLELADALVSHDAVEPIGLGARDSLRLEAGLCLYGHDIDETTSPVEAALTWAIQKARRDGGDRSGGFPGASRVFDEFENGPERKRVGLLPDGRAPMREGTLLFAEEDGPQIGHVTSGGFGPSVNGPVSMGYVSTDHSTSGTLLFGEVRGKKLPVKVAAMPFIEPGYKR
jgi:aminomethyltransferase